MDTTEKLNAVVDYIENHLTNDIDINQLAKIACCSTYDVNRMFLLVADISITEYIRKRRMTLAGYELKYNQSKVIDTACKYGYDSPVSFTCAFLNFHGVKPSEARNRDALLHTFPKLIFKISVREVIPMIRKEKMTVSGKEYDASYFGEIDMSTWSDVFSKREYWRLENAFEDFKNKPKTNHVLPYNNYPAMDIKTGQMFVIDYYRKSDGLVERKYYISDGTVWQDMPSTDEIVIQPLLPLKTGKKLVGGKEYEASYFGETDISSWSKDYMKREYWRLENINGDFNDIITGNDVLPYNNYPPIDIKAGQIFLIVYTKKDGTNDINYYVADGTVWQDMPCTREFTIK